MRHVVLYAVALFIAGNAINGNSHDKLHQSSHNNAILGVAYLYITDETVETGWQLSAKSISSNRNTLAPLYKNENGDKILWTLYNDSPPDASSVGTYGHTKGTAAVNRHQGFWLVHSVPKFPPAPRGGNTTRPSKKDHLNITGAYKYPETGMRYGQSFLCVSLHGDQFHNVSKQLMYNDITVYSKNIPATFATKYPELRDAANQIRIKFPPYYRRADIKSLRSVQFTSLAKGHEFRKDLYADFVAPELQTDLFVQSWHPEDNLPSVCTGRKVINVHSLAFDIANVYYSRSNDHSKWAISVTNRTAAPWVCIADINRAITQHSRGGGSLCFEQPRLWTQYRKVISASEDCTPSYM